MTPSTVGTGLKLLFDGGQFPTQKLAVANNKGKPQTTIIVFNMTFVRCFRGKDGLLYRNQLKWVTCCMEAHREFSNKM